MFNLLIYYLNNIKQAGDCMLVEDYIEFLSRELFIAKSMYELYIVLYGATAQYLDAMNIAPGFFQAATEAFLENSALRMCKIYDKNTAALTINKLLNTLQSDHEVNELFHDRIKDALPSCREKLVGIQSFLPQLYALRDSSLAHNDTKFCFVDAFSVVGLNIEDYHQLIITGEEILNEVRRALSKPPSVNISDALEAMIVIDALDRYIKEHPEFIEEAERRRNSHTAAKIEEVLKI